MKPAFDQFLARALRGEGSAWSDSGQGADDLSRVMGRISLHGIALMLANKGDTIASWPEELQESVIEEGRLQQIWEVSHHRMLQGLLKRLADAGLDTVVMKGTALAYSLYENPAMRRRGDTDLLVREDQLGAVRAILAEQGLYRSHDVHGLLFQETWLHETAFGAIHGIDLHWRTCDSPVLERVLPTADLFATSLPLPRLCRSARMADPVLTFIQVALNRGWHVIHGYHVDGERIGNGERLIWASDFDRLARGMAVDQWERLVTLAIDRQVAVIVRDALGFAVRSFGTPVPDAVLRRLDAAPVSSPPYDFLRQQDALHRRWADLGASRGIRAKLTFLAKLAYPDEEYLRGCFPAASGWPRQALYGRWVLANTLFRRKKRA